MKTNIEIGGMTCAACALRIEKALTKAEGVDSARVNFATSRAVIEFDSDNTDREILKKIVVNTGYSPLESREERLEMANKHFVRMRGDFFFALVFTSLLVYIAMAPHVGLPLYKPISSETSPLFNAVIQLLLALPALYAGRHFFTSGYKSAIALSPNMDTLVSIGSLTSFFYSIASLILLEPAKIHEHLYFEASAAILTLVLMGKLMEEGAKRKAGSALDSLTKLLPDKAIRIIEGEPQVIDIVDIEPSDELLVKAHESIPADGNLLGEKAYIDESMITGESMPVEKKEGEKLIGGTLNGSTALRMRVSRIGGESTLGTIVRMVESAQSEKAPIARIADRVSAVFVPTVIVLAFLFAGAWYMTGSGISFATTIFVSVLVIACPCALGLATPVSIMVATGKGASMGLLIRSAGALEELRNIDMVLFDKTGTLTVGKPSVNEAVYAGSVDPPELLRYASGVEISIDHPLAGAIVEYARAEGIKGEPAQNVIARAGYGAKGDFDDKEIYVGSLRYMQDEGIETGPEFSGKEGAGNTLVYVAENKKVSALFIISDKLKKESADVIASLKKRGIKTAMISGDTRENAKQVAQQTGIDEYHAPLLPEEKIAVIKKLKTDGIKVAMVGDGINDAPALALADIGIAIGSGTDVAIDSADIILMRDDLAGIEKIIGLGRATYFNIRQNLFWAFVYNIIGIPVAGGLLAVFGGPLLTPALASFAMSLSSVSVVLNALRLKRYR